MTVSIAGRKRCRCGRYLTTLANGTMPRHRLHNDLRRRCHGTGKFPPVTVAWRQARADRYRAKGDLVEAGVTLPAQIADPATKRSGNKATVNRNRRAR